MTWLVWSCIWGASLAFTAIVAGLSILIGVWTIPVVFVLIFFGLGFVVTR